MIRDVEMQQFMHDHIIPNLRLKLEQLSIEAQSAIR